MRLSALVAATSLVSSIVHAAPYEQMVQKVANMTGDENAYSIAEAYKLQILNVLWEDTGRWEGSSVGPNISDVTIEVEGASERGARRTYLMPVIRYNDYTD